MAKSTLKRLFRVKQMLEGQLQFPPPLTPGRRGPPGTGTE